METGFHVRELNELRSLGHLGNHPCLDEGDFLNELRSLGRLGNHPCLVSLLGGCIESILLVVEMSLS